MVSKDSDVPSSPATPLPSAPGTSASSSDRRSCLRCTRRMSSLKYDKHLLHVGTPSVQLMLGAASATPSH